MELCKKYPSFAVNNFLFTYDPRGEGVIKINLPFLLYNYQEEALSDIKEHIEIGRDYLIEKSRDMGATWLLAVAVWWGWRFRHWDILVGSRKAEEVDTRGDMNTFLEKIRYIELRLPDWLQVKIVEADTDKKMLIMHPDNKNIITGESNNPYFGTGGRFRCIVFDEFSKWELTDDVAWRSAGDASPCRIANSTPSERGTACHFYKLIEQGIDKFTMHWTRHPLKRKGLYYMELDKKVLIDEDDWSHAYQLWRSGIRVGSDWYDKECLRRSDIDIAQELDIAYDASLAGAIFSKFDYEKQAGDYEYNPNIPLYLGHDYGMDTTALLWIQFDGKHHYVIDEYEAKGEDVTHYIEIIQAKPYKTAIHFGDPYSGGVRQMQQARTVAQVLMRAGIRIRLANRVSVMDRINASRMLVNNLRVSKKCPLFLDTIVKWRFKKPQRGGDKAIPEHSVYSHLGEAFGYYALSYKDLGKKQIPHKQWSSTTGGVTL